MVPHQPPKSQLFPSGVYNLEKETGRKLSGGSGVTQIASIPLLIEPVMGKLM